MLEWKPAHGTFCSACLAVSEFLLRLLVPLDFLPLQHGSLTRGREPFSSRRDQVRDRILSSSESIRTHTQAKAHSNMDSKSGLAKFVARGDGW